MGYLCTTEQFLKDVDRHGISCVKDYGVYRYLRFRGPESITYWFDLIFGKVKGVEFMLSLRE